MRSIRCADWTRSGRSGPRFTGPSATLWTIRKWTPGHAVRGRAFQGLVGDLCLGDARCPSASLGQPRTGGSPGAGRAAMAVEGFGAVGAAGGGGAVGVQGDGPSLLVDGHVVVIKTIQCAAVDAGLAAVGQVGHMVHFTR